jgi:hypothetical protein
MIRDIEGLAALGRARSPTMARVARVVGFNRPLNHWRSPMALDFFEQRALEREIDNTSAQIQAALWGTANDGLADIELAKVLISKRMGFRVLLGERAVTLKPPLASEALAA